MKKIGYIGPAVLLAMLLLASSLLIVDPEEVEVEAQKSPTTDAMGYTWIDNRGSDPKVTYDWMDITGVGTALKTKIASYSTYRYLPYLISPPEKLGFDFPYYGSTYDEILVYPNGVLGFGSGVTYSYYNYGGAFPSTYSYTPPGTIAAYWVYYGGPRRDDAKSDIWVYQGTTTEGMKYWVCSWVDVTYYGTSASGATMQVILYQNGDIKVHILESNQYTSSYCTIGIQNLEKNIGTSYSYQTIPPDFTAILFKQFKTEISNVTFAKGYGPDENIYPAQAGMGQNQYWATADFWVESNTEDLSNIDMVIGPGSEDIILRYNFKTESFQKINDGSRMMVMDETKSAISYNLTDPEHSLSIKFVFDFNLNWLRLDLVDVNFYITGTGMSATLLLFNDVFRVETRMRMVGNLTITDFKGRELERGDWVKGGDVITFTGVERRYADPNIPILPPDFIQIGIEDETGIVFTGDSSDLMDVEVLVPEFYPDVEYWLVFINVDENNDMSDPYYKGFRFLVQVDSDKPGLPGELVIRPDSFDDQARVYDDDPDVYLSWKDAVDQSSGVAMYHISINKDKEEAHAAGSRIIDIQKGTLTALIDNLEEGRNTLYIWAEDAVGNEGNSIFIDVIIDLEPVYFSDFYPVTGEWINTLRPRCSIVIHDDLTGVDPLTIEYEISTSGEVGLVGEWNTISDPYAPGDEIRVVVEGWFKNGKDNWIHFRAKDMAGNDYVESEAFNVWVDAKSPTYKLLSHSEDEYQLNPLQEVRIQILDEQSWVDAASIEYRITTQGQTKWSQWLPYKDATDGPKPVVTLREHFRRGSDNFVQVRAKDLAGNPVASSKAFNIRINTYPVIVVVSPSSGDLLMEDIPILFDAGDSYDPDGDRLTLSWIKSTPTGPVSLGEAGQISARLPPGEHTITVIAKDRVNNEVQFTFVITVSKEDDPPIPPTQDTDDDGIPDIWEIPFQTDPFVKDAMEDFDGDGFKNYQEYENNTHPWIAESHPPIPPDPAKDESLKIFSSEAWPLWALLAVLVIAVVLVMFVAKAKKDKQVKRIQSVRNMRKIMPSVSWDQITTTAYMAPMTAGAGLPASAGPALPSAAPTIPVDQALPPAQQADIAAHEAAHVLQQQESAPEPAPFGGPQQ